MTDNRVSENKSRGRRRRRNVDLEQESLRASVAGPGRTQSSGHKGHAAGGLWDEVKEGGKYPHQPEHGIWPSARAVYGLPAVTSRGAGEMGNDVKLAGPAQANQKS